MLGAAVLTSLARSWDIQSAQPWVGREGDLGPADRDPLTRIALACRFPSPLSHRPGP